MQVIREIALIGCLALNAVDITENKTHATSSYFYRLCRVAQRGQLLIMTQDRPALCVLTQKYCDWLDVAVFFFMNGQSPPLT